jgi:hypothetical protein
MSTLPSGPHRMAHALAGSCLTKSQTKPMMGRAMTVLVASSGVSATTPNSATISRACLDLVKKN